MKIDTFNDAMLNLHDYYGMKEPSKRKRNIVFERVKFIPEESVEWIISKIEDEMDSLPRNIGKAMKLNYQAWLITHKNKIQVLQPTKCDECKGYGLLWYSAFNEEMGLRYNHLAVCAKCDNWRKHGTERESLGYSTTKEELLSRGFQLEGPTKDRPTADIRKPVKEMVANVGKSIRDMPAREPKYCCEMAKHGGHTDECPNNTKGLLG